MTKTPRVPLLFPGLLLLAGLLVAGDAVVARLMTDQTPTLREQLRREVEAEKIRRLSTSNLARDPAPPNATPCPRKMLLAYWTMSGQRGTPTNPMHHVFYRTDPENPTTWREFVRETVQPRLDDGYRRVMIHLPFGKDPRDSWMSFDAYIHAQERELDALWKGFARAWRPVVRGKYTDGEPVQLICYLGALDHDEDFVRLLAKPTTRDQWLWRAWKSTRAVLDAGGEIAFDTAGPWPPDVPGYGFVKMINAMGAGGWLEGTEIVRRPADQPYRWRDPETNEWRYWNPELIEFKGHWRGMPVTANHAHYWRNMTKTADGLGHPPSTQYDSIKHYGPVILLLDGHSAPLNKDGTKKPLAEIFATAPDWMPAMVQRNVEAGFSTAVSQWATGRHGDALSMEKLLGCPTITGDNDQ